jgi:hypothetical protein
VSARFTNVDTDRRDDSRRQKAHGAAVKSPERPDEVADEQHGVESVDDYRWWIDEHQRREQQALEERVARREEHERKVLGKIAPGADERELHKRREQRQGRQVDDCAYSIHQN